MLGKDLYRIEKCQELSNDEVKSLSLFYRPLIGSHSYALYMNMLYGPAVIETKELNCLCTVMNMSIDRLEKSFEILNKYRLIKTLKKEEADEYIFVVCKPLSMNEFTRNNIYSRNFILNCGGPLYQEILADMTDTAVSHRGFKDVSSKLDASVLESWSLENESYIEPRKDSSTYRIDSFFDINGFLKDISDNLFPKKYRTLENLKAIAEMADIYNISKDKMRTYIPSIIRSDSNEFDLKMLKNKCMYSQSDYRKLGDDEYAVPCILFLMNLQDGKEVSEYDRKILFKLSDSYNLNPVVINTLLEVHLKKYDNRIIEKILYSDASDLHRNNVDTRQKALARLGSRNTNNTGRDIVPDYKETNRDVDMSNLETFLKNRN